jgi:hypothetical protein
MKIYQEEEEFNPITLTLETPTEVEALRGLVRLICYCSAEQKSLTADKILASQHKLALEISDAFTEGRVGIN